MNRPQRNKPVRRDYNIEIADLVIDSIKEGRKSSKMFKSDTKSKKSSSKSKKKPPKKNIIQKIFEYSFTIKEKTFKEPPKLFIYTINTNVLWKEKKMRSSVIISNAFDFQRFNNEII